MITVMNPSFTICNNNWSKIFQSCLTDHFTLRDYFGNTLEYISPSWRYFHSRKGSNYSKVVHFSFGKINLQKITSREVHLLLNSLSLQETLLTLEQILFISLPNDFSPTSVWWIYFSFLVSSWFDWWAFDVLSSEFHFSHKGEWLSNKWEVFANKKHEKWYNIETLSVSL